MELPNNNRIPCLPKLLTSFLPDGLFSLSPELYFDSALLYKRRSGKVQRGSNEYLSYPIMAAPPLILSNSSNSSPFVS